MVVDFTAANNIGMTTGKRSTGNNISRARVFTEIAESRVPTAAKPSVPRKTTRLRGRRIEKMEKPD